MTVIGLTGSLGTGKTTVASMFQDLGAVIIDADKIAHQLIEERPCRTQIIKNFPEAVDQGRVDRATLASIVFKNEEKLKQLEEILHPAVYRRIKCDLRAISKENKRQVVVVEIPLLLEAGFDDLVDAVVVVKANRDQSIDRVIRQRHQQRQDILKRLGRQMPQREKCQLADFIIDNRYSKAKTRAQVKQIWVGLVGI